MGVLASGLFKRVCGSLGTSRAEKHALSFASPSQIALPPRLPTVLRLLHRRLHRLPLPTAILLSCLSLFSPPPPLSFSFVFLFVLVRYVLHTFLISTVHGDPSRESNVREILRRYFRRGVTIDFFSPSPDTAENPTSALNLPRSYPVRAHARFMSRSDLRDLRSDIYRRLIK